MGHVRLGRLPATRKWDEVVALLGGDSSSMQALADAVENAAITALKKAANDMTLVAAVQMLYDIPQAAKEPDFVAALKERGINVPQNPTILDVAQGMAQALDEVSVRSGLRTDIGEMAKHAAIAAFIDSAGKASNTLWDPTPADMQSGIASFTNPSNFGELNQNFNIELSYKVLNYFVQRALPQHISATGPFHSIADVRIYEAGLRKHCTEMSVIMRPFMRDWLGKQYSSKNKVGTKDIAKAVFVSTNKTAKEQKKRGKNA